MKPWPWIPAALLVGYLIGYAEGYLVGEREGKDASTEAHDEELGEAYRMGVAHGTHTQEVMVRKARNGV